MSTSIHSARSRSRYRRSRLSESGFLHHPSRPRTSLPRYSGLLRMPISFLLHPDIGGEHRTEQTRHGELDLVDLAYRLREQPDAMVGQLLDQPAAVLDGRPIGRIKAA